MGTRYIDPIEHGWRHCNPHTRLPSALVRRAKPFWLYSSHGHLAANLTPKWESESGHHRSLQCAALT
jgi:hypothetical protein